MSDNKSKSSNTILDDEKDILLEHEYDGIQELDNSLPQWWLITFYITIAFAVFYVGYYHVFGGPSSDEQLAQALDKVEHAQAQAEANTEELGESAFLALTKDPEVLAQGKEVYMGKCAACHAANGGGLIGPNLADNYWIHGQGKMADIQELIAKGVPEKGMPPWEAVLSPEELRATTAFVKSLVGSNPENAKEPQGQKVGG